jgi:alkanesulfonate monooxygenase SsuD/methylene tetrahydromethanopterin reductase-like flavin-dependent oxidoreductase (luciferase family)
MAAQFLSDLPSLSDSSDATQPPREPVKLIIIGSAEGVREKIHLMHQRHVADVGLWSRLMPMPNSDEVMSILVLYRQREAP